METWKHGDMEHRQGDMETWRNGEMETWRLRDMRLRDMETWT
jgi:hypothetical protein